MIQDKLKNILNQYQSGNNNLFTRTVLKEALQDYVLNFVYNDARYKTLIFTGGTCLRKIYGLPRLSEDLDFDFLDTLEIEHFANRVKAYFVKNLQYNAIIAKISGNKQTVFLKFPVLKLILFVRCDFSKETIGSFTTEINAVSTSEFTFFVTSYDLPTLFANKIMAFLTRDFFKGKGQSVPFKGRDLFDLVWFLEKSKKSDWKLRPSWERLVRGLKINNPNKIVDLIVKKVASIDKKDAYADLLPFIESRQTLENFSENFSFLIKENIKNVI